MEGDSPSPTYKASTLLKVCMAYCKQMMLASLLMEMGGGTHDLLPLPPNVNLIQRNVYIKLLWGTLDMQHTLPHPLPSK